jgi:hypothetical protein
MFKNEFRFHVEPQTDGAEIWDVFLLHFMSNYKNISYDVDNENNLRENKKQKTWLLAQFKKSNQECLNILNF